MPHKKPRHSSARTEVITLLAIFALIGVSNLTTSGPVLVLEIFLAVFLAMVASQLVTTGEIRRIDPAAWRALRTKGHAPEEQQALPAEKSEAPQEERTAKEEAEAPQALPEAQGEPDPAKAEPQDKPAFDFPAFQQGLLEADEPLDYLKQVVGDIRTREARAEDDDETTDAPTEFERYLARRLVEAGLLRPADDFPHIGIVMPHRSDTFYIRVYAQSISLLAAMRILRIESALNAALFTWRHFADRLDEIGEEELFAFDQALAASICAQVEGSDLGLALPGDEPDGEWAVRHAISCAIESVQLPHRLTASFRTNVAKGNVAIQVDLTHSRLFANSAFVEGLGVVSTTSDMRRIAATQYALRLGILLAACAFRSSERIQRVWVAGVIDGPLGHKCYYTVRFEREAFAKIDLSHVDDPVQTYLDAGANLHLMGPKDGSFTYDGYYVHDHAILLPVEQDLSLDDEAFCPRSRYDSVTLSSRPLTSGQAQALGTNHVSGLAISEDDERDRVADDIALRLTTSTEKNVRTILDVAGDDPDLSVRDAAARTIQKLIAGQLPDDPFAVREEFANGDVLTQAVEAARSDLEARDFAMATRRLEGALSPIDAAGTYADTSTIVYRAFSTYVERALYNRLKGEDTRAVLLVPDAYLEAHVMLCFSLLAAQSDPEGALAHARRAYEVAPLDMRTNLNLIACLELTGDLTAAREQCVTLLRYAHDPQGIGLGYYRIAGLEWAEGHHEVAQACYQRCMRTIPQTAPFVGMELAALVGGDVSQIEDAMTDERIDGLLSGQDIPLAPTEQVRQIIREGVSASLDAEVFPVARSFANLLGALSGDDVVLGIIRSMEGEPDR